MTWIENCIQAGENGRYLMVSLNRDKIWVAKIKCTMEADIEKKLPTGKAADIGTALDNLEHNLEQDAADIMLNGGWA